MNMDMLHAGNKAFISAKINKDVLSALYLSINSQNSYWNPICTLLIREDLDVFGCYRLNIERDFRYVGEFSLQIPIVGDAEVRVLS